MEKLLAIIYAAIIILGMFLGGTLASAFVCLIMRRKAGIPWADASRSHCDSCGRTLSFIDLIPVVSYLILGGKCRTCKAKIPTNGFVVELTWSMAFGLIAALILRFPSRPIIIACVSLFAIAISVVVMFVKTKDKII